jgi:flagellar basal-body rod protein FlgB
MAEPIERTTMALMGLALDAASMRQQAGANNIATVNTGTGRVATVEFEKHLGAVRTSLAAGLPVTADQVSHLRPRTVWASGAQQGVATLDQEMAALSQNAVQHLALVRSLNLYLELRSAAINDGKR